MAERARILIAEDETIIRLDLRELVERAGFVVCAEARNGLEAVELAREFEPDAAILDVKMPQLDGIEAARRIMDERPLPIVMLTAYCDRELVARAAAAGVFGYLVKPFRETDVMPALVTAQARFAEAFDRTGGRDASTRFDLNLPSAGAEWPLSFSRRPDGSLHVTVREPS